jgi:hypothetical protein
MGDAESAAALYSKAVRLLGLGSSGRTISDPQPSIFIDKLRPLQASELH